MSSENQPESPENKQQAERFRAKFPKSLSVIAGLFSVAIVALVILAQSATKDGKYDGQFSGNWINGLAALVAVLNVVLTFYILRTALGQLEAFQHDINSQEKRHAEQLRRQEDQSRADIERQEQLRAKETESARQERANMQHLLTIQTEALKLAQADAERSHRETAKTRLDLIGPRCSIILEGVEVNFLRTIDAVNELVNEAIAIKDSVDEKFLRLVYTFRIKNWGDQPVSFSLDHKWSNAGNHMLMPGQDAKSTWEIKTSLRHWVQIAKKEASLFSVARPDDPTRAALIELYIIVNNTGGDVTDTFKWNQFVMPIEIQELGVLIHDGKVLYRRSRPFAVPTRDYAQLRDRPTEG
ncbi:hypothetical protein ACFFSW_37075 [Saccharothrix longispora]|uniref:Uncharacterized protein n=2 Tax=Saccharothrix longispora TaxID=33920 RepID=A0ABU1PRW8_9PSEU|nr:hypothetical protein [Saccharothrix longispora]